MAGLGAIIGAVASGLSPSVLFLYIFFAVFFVTCAGMTINDYYDVEIDKVNAPQRPLPSGRMSKRQAFVYSIILFSLGILFSAFLNVYCFLLAFLNSILEWIYSRNLKRMFLLGNITVSYFTASAFIFGALITFDFQIAGIIALLAFLANMGREIFKGIEDIKGDKRMKLDTLPIATGIDSAKEIAQGFIASAVLLSPLPYLSGLLNSFYFRLASIGNILLLYSLSQTPSRVKELTKIAMFIVMLAVLLGM